MDVHSAFETDLDPPGSLGLRLAFLTLWGIDMVAATLFFLVPYATELNPITVLFYGLFGLPGVALAAVCYAAIVIGLGHVLSDPIDRRFVSTMVAVYLALAANNVFLLLFREAPLTPG
ncbi:hypothetical protein CV102_05675 [Natronococcus pandeyae]|uniref:DUF5658 domain-containing protein n=1 Tax=Natronococcus pandeyae TaxID=2055836 RepID=A0A8J8TRQ9_9EURY|nr:hypothetical protein [Natronococcus pandeyae]TYL39773.1 hypothetical protein CV102_05675 [Natronococcus pandeyae]